ncbi:19461_t:CDS:2, partial [Entrophospora sp. SA101]
NLAEVQHFEVLIQASTTNGLKKDSKILLNRACLSIRGSNYYDGLPYSSQKYENRRQFWQKDVNERLSSLRQCGISSINADEE